MLSFVGVQGGPTVGPFPFQRPFGPYVLAQTSRAAGCYTGAVTLVHCGGYSYISFHKPSWFAYAAYVGAMTF